MTTSLTTSLHPSEEGPKFFMGKAYYWDKVEGRLTLHRWPDHTDTGLPLEYADLPRGVQQ